MATWPDYAKVLVDGFGVSDSDIVERTQMDRGVPKQRRTQSDVIKTANVTVLFDSKESAADFEDWCYDEAGAGLVWFGWEDPIRAVTYQARVVANTLGAIQPSGGSMKNFTRTLQIEYLRPLS